MPAEPHDSPELVLPQQVASLATAELEGRICTWAAHLAAAECAWLQLVAEFDRREGFARWGLASTAQWLSWRCGLAPSAARERVRVARALQVLPLVLKNFALGTLSYSKARAITRVADADTEADLVELAHNATASQLDRIVAAFDKVLGKEALALAEQQHERRSLHYTYDDGGNLVGTFRLRPDDAPGFVAAIEEHLPTPITAVEREAGVAESTASQRRADALVALADAACGVLPRSAGERVVAHIEVDAAVLAADAPGKCRMLGGAPLSAETARRLTCDCMEVIEHTDPDDEALHSSKARRSIPRSARRALLRRDQGRCQFPGCETKRWVDAHHIVHRAQGGSNDLQNLVTLCRRHHHAVHEGGFRCNRTATGRLAFAGPDGTPLEPAPAPAGTPRHVIDATRQRGLDIDPDTVAGGIGESLDLELTIWTLAANRQVRRSRSVAPGGASAEARSPRPQSTAEGPPI